MTPNTPIQPENQGRFESRRRGRPLYLGYAQSLQPLTPALPHEALGFVRHGPRDWGDESHTQQSTGSRDRHNVVASQRSNVSCYPPQFHAYTNYASFQHPGQDTDFDVNMHETVVQNEEAGRNAFVSHHLHIPGDRGERMHNAQFPDSELLTQDSSASLGVERHTHQQTLSKGKGRILSPSRPEADPPYSPVQYACATSALPVQTHNSASLSFSEIKPWVEQMLSIWIQGIQGFPSSQQVAGFAHATNTCVEAVNTWLRHQFQVAGLWPNTESCNITYPAQEHPWTTVMIGIENFIAAASMTACHNHKSPGGELKCINGHGCTSSWPLHRISDWRRHLKICCPQEFWMCDVDVPDCAVIEGRREWLASHIHYNHRLSEAAANERAGSSKVSYSPPFHRTCGFCNIPFDNFTDFTKHLAHEHFAFGADMSTWVDHESVMVLQQDTDSDIGMVASASTSTVGQFSRHSNRRSRRWGRRAGSFSSRGSVQGVADPEPSSQLFANTSDAQQIGSWSVYCQIEPGNAGELGLRRGMAASVASNATWPPNGTPGSINPSENLMSRFIDAHERHERIAFQEQQRKERSGSSPTELDGEGSIDFDL